MNVYLLFGIGSVLIGLGILISLLFYKITFMSLLLSLIGIGLFIWGSLDYMKLKGVYGNQIQIIRKVFFSLCIAWLFSFLIIQGLILTESESDQGKQVDYVIVLGAGLRGETPSLTLQTRLAQGLKYLNAHPEVSVIVSGGQGPGETITEAEAMERFFVNNGIEESRIIKEDKSTSTMENLMYSKEKINSRGIGKKRVLIVTSDFHMFRSKYLAKKVGLVPYGMPSKTPVYLWIDYCIREYFAIIKSFVFD